MASSKTVAEFFAGIGLMRLGLDQDGWETVYANDIDEKKQEMYEAHFGEDETFVPGDVHTIAVSK